MVSQARRRRRRGSPASAMTRWRPATPFRSPANMSPKTTFLRRSKAAARARSMRRARSVRARRRRLKAGIGPSRRRRLANPLSALLFALAFIPMMGAKAEALLPYTIVGDGIPDSLTGKPGDAVRGRTLVLDRASTCILCHSGPLPEARFQGDLAPNLAGAGNRWSVSQLRL